MQIRRFQKDNYDVFETAAAILGVTPAELCVQLGFADNTFHGWKNSGAIPRVVAVACEGLVASKGKQIPREVLVAFPPGDKVLMLKQMLDAMQINYNVVL